jgi:hypothetical protein
MKQTALHITVSSIMLLQLAACQLSQFSMAQPITTPLPVSTTWQMPLQQAIKKYDWPAAQIIILSQPEQERENVSLAAMREIAKIEDDRVAEKLFKQALYFIDHSPFGKPDCPPYPADEIYGQRFSIEYHAEHNRIYVPEEIRYKNAIAEINNILQSVKINKSKNSYRLAQQQFRQIIEKSLNLLELNRSHVRSLDTCQGIGDVENADRGRILMEYTDEIEARMFKIVTASIKLNTPDITKMVLENFIKSTDASAVDYRIMTRKLLDKLSAELRRSPQARTEAFTLRQLKKYMRSESL